MGISPCPPNTPITRGIVTFSATAFKTLYPAFATVADAILNQNFVLSQVFLNNTCGSVVRDANLRETLLNLLVAHITMLFNPPGGGGGGLVGRVDSATEGADSISAEFPMNPSNAWFLQTQWGAMYWAATAAFRTMRYVAPPAVCADFPGGGVFPIGGPGCGC